MTKTIDPEIQRQMTGRLRSNEEIVWAAKTPAYHIKENNRVSNSLSARQMTSIVICLNVPFIILLVFVPAARVFAASIIVAITLGILYASNAELDESYEQESRIIGGYILTNQRFIELDHVLNYSRCQPAPKIEVHKILALPNAKIMEKFINQFS